MQTLSTSQKMPVFTGHAEPLALQSGLDTLTVGLGFLTASHEFGYVNACFRRMLDSNAAEPCGRSLASVLNLSAKLASEVVTDLQTRKLWRGMIRLHDKVVKVEIRSLPAIDLRLLPEDEEMSHSVLLVDYSNDLKHLHKLVEAKNVAERTDKAKSEFLSHMSHELRTPLNAILGFTQLLRLAPELNPIQQDNLSEIESAGHYLLGLINEILDLSRIEAGKIRLNQEEVSVAALASECQALVLPLAAGRNIRLEQQVSVDSFLLTDHVRLKQIILNLLSNAIKYNRDNGSVQLRCFPLDENRMRLEIQDSGPGIEAAKLRCIFSPFERLGADSTHIEGTGIGLMITRRLVTLMEGEIGVFSLEGQGSVFWVELPRNQPPLLDDLLATSPEFEPLAIAPIPLLWVGARGRLYSSVQRLQALRPALRLHYCEETRDASIWIRRLQPGLIFVTETSLGKPGLEHIALDLLKPGLVHVVKEHESGGPATRCDAGAYSYLTSDIRLVELLNVLDSVLLPA